MTTERLREHFHKAKLGTITDAKLATKHDGTSRGFGFVGYQSAEEALKAKEYFDKTFVGTSRVQVEVVAKVSRLLRSVKRNAGHFLVPSQQRTNLGLLNGLAFMVLLRQRNLSILDGRLPNCRWNQTFPTQTKVRVL